MKYILYNRLANNNGGKKAALRLNDKIREVVLDIPKEATMIAVEDVSYKEFLADKTAEDEVYIVGGDGTLNRFVNDVYGCKFAPKIYFYPAGSGNDFFNDQSEKIENDMIEIGAYMRDLPKVFVNGIEKRFLNGIGFGLDGVCCEIGDDIRAKSDKKINYTAIALKLCLYAYKPRNAVVTIDGERLEFKKVWIAPSMKGRFYGGGMMIAPKQNRFDEDKKLTLVVVAGGSRLGLLFNFPKLFKGNVDKVGMVHTFTGKEISVEFDEPTAVQIDGDTVRNVLKYTVKAED